jgi:DNA primase
MNENVSRNELTFNILRLLNLKTKKSISPSTKETMVSCPYHKDKTPSMAVNFDGGVYYCFSCGRSGSIETLFKDLTGQNIYRVLGIHNDPFSSLSFNRKFSHSYSFDDTNSSLKNVYINYDPADIKSVEDYPEVLNYLSRRGVSLAVAKKAKISYIEDGTINTTRFYRRLVIPVYENKKLISIEGRRVYPDDPDPKVLYPKNATVNTLYDIDNLDRSKPCFAVEGLMDLFVLRASEATKNSTSIFGASLTKRQLSLIKTFSKFIYIPDRDAAGQKTVDTLKESGLDNVYILSIPKQLGNFAPKDVGDFPKANITVDDLVSRKWFSYIKKIESLKTN